MSVRAGRVAARRIIRTVLVGALVPCVVVLGILAYHAAAASRATDARTTETVRAAFVQAASGWRRHIDLPVQRLALSSAEEYGSGNYIFVFDVYSWYGIGSGYVTHGDAGGGLIRDGGFAGIGEQGSDSGLQETRAAWTRTYGPGRLVAPIP